MLTIIFFILPIYSYYKYYKIYFSWIVPNILQINPRRYLIIVNFHWPRYNVIDRVIRNVIFFQKYFKYQSEYICIGPQDNYNGIRVYNNSLPPNGFYSYYSFNIAIKHRGNSYYGYIFMNDDSLLNPFVFNRIDLNLPFGASFGINSNKNVWWNPNKNRFGISFWEAQNNFINEILKHGIVKHNITRYSGYSDFFYVTNKYVNFFCQMFYYACKNGVFLEMAIPTTLHSINESYSIPECNHGFNKSYRCFLFDLNRCPHIHPIKMTNSKITNIINAYYQNVTQNFYKPFCY